jgi:hypothetical protein
MSNEDGRVAQGGLYPTGSSLFTPKFLLSRSLTVGMIANTLREMCNVKSGVVQSRVLP